MATLKAPKTISKRQELRKDKAVTVFVRAQEFFYQNRTLVYGIAGSIVLLLVLFAGLAFMQSQRGATAEELLGGIILVYEKGEYRSALDGTPEAVGLLELVDDYGGTEAGNMARFYAADALFRLGEYDQALEFFQDFDKEGNIVGASALAGEAAIHEIKGDHDRAGDLYREAATMVENDVVSPQYLLAAGRAYEQGEQYAEARDAYQALQEQYPESTEAQGIDYYLGRVAAKMK